MAAASLTACALLVDTSDLGSGAAPGGGNTDSGGGGGGGGSDGGVLEGSVEPQPSVGCPAAGHSCVPEAPSGWAGPLLVYDGPENAVPVCPGTMATARIDAHRGFIAPAKHTCSSCGCGPGDGGACQPLVAKYPLSNCGGTPTVSALSGCFDTGGNGGVVVSVINTGSCPPTGGEATHPSATWQASVRACGAPSLLRTGCPNGNVCTPDAPNPFKAHHCITATGDVACPGAPYTQKTVVASSVDDTRDCTKCECGVGNGCGNTALAYGSAGCSGGSTNVSLDICSPGSSAVSVKASSPPTPGPFTCEPANSATPTGTLAPSQLATICCAP